jgi:hypothetical protein
MAVVRTLALSAFGHDDITVRHTDSQRNIQKRILFTIMPVSIHDMSQNAVIGFDASCRFCTNKEGLAQPKDVVRIISISNPL